MSLLGTILLALSFGVSLLGTLLFTWGARKGASGSSSPTCSEQDKAGRFASIVALAVFILLLCCCGLIVFCFVSGDTSLEYVVEHRSDSESNLAWLYTLSGLWAGRQGSLLFWAWLISAFDLFVALRARRGFTRLDAAALAISQAVLTAFLGVLLFSKANTPFAATMQALLDDDGSLSIMGSLVGLNALLEHWAMAIHPPTLFIGYAGLTLPFAYALGTFILGDDSDLWVRRVNGIALFSWLFLGLGIGLGAVWAYVVLGWGGYWGWDPVENASLLSWICCVALVHSFTVYRRHGQFKRWSIVAACLTFFFVILGTFISRSGLVQSVHAFEGDSVSLAFFVVLLVVTGLSALAGALGRRKTFAVVEDDDDAEGSLLSREMAYFLTNVLMVACAFVLAYLTLSSAFPSFLPFGGQSVGTETYAGIARPLGIVVAAIIAICPLLGWSHTDPKHLLKNARVPGACALVLFVLLLVYFFKELYPVYAETILRADSIGDALREGGPSLWYNGLAILGFVVACLLLFNSLLMLVKLLKSGKGKGLRRRASTLGGLLAHAAMGIILIGLIGSSMYVTERSGYVEAEPDNEGQAQFAVQDYRIVPIKEDYHDGRGDGAVYELTLQVFKGDELVSTQVPSIQVDPLTQQQKLNASVYSRPLHDLFIVYRGVNMYGDWSLDVRINPLVSFVWLGFGLLMLGTAIGVLAKRDGAVGKDGENEKAGEAA